MTGEEAVDDKNCCASCGIAEVDDIKEKECAACKSVQYCSVACEKNHRPQHKKTCEKRMTELRDEILFRQPESTHLGDCPICLLPLSMDEGERTMTSCCSKLICNGCFYADTLRLRGAMLEQRCPFCRQLWEEANAEDDLMFLMKRIEVNDPVAIREKGALYSCEGDKHKAFEYWNKAAGLGDIKAHYNLSVMYHDGEGVERDEKKMLYHWEEAAIGGHPDARYNLACYERINGRIDRAVKHLMIAAKLGHDVTLENLRRGYAIGFVSKEDFATALRAHQAATDATKSLQREKAVEAIKKGYLKLGCLKFKEA